MAELRKNPRIVLKRGKLWTLRLFERVVVEFLLIFRIILFFLRGIFLSTFRRNNREDAKEKEAASAVADWIGPESQIHQIRTGQSDRASEKIGWKRSANRTIQPKCSANQP